MQSMKKTWQNVLYICILLAAIVMLFQWYSLSNRQRIEKQNLDYAVNTADQTAERIEGEFQNALLRIRNYAYLLGTTQDEPEITAEILRQMEQNTAFNAIHYTGPDGFTLSSGGERLDSRSRYFYQNAMRGQSGIDLVRASDNERLMMVFYAPIMHGGEPRGVMLGLYFTEDYLQDVLNVNFFGEPAEAFLCTRTGEVIAGSSGSTFDAGVADLLLRTGSIDAEMAEEINICLRSENGLVGLTCAPGSLTDNLCICPIRGSEYMLLQTFPKSVTQSMLRNANHSGMVLQIILILLFAAYILILLLRARRERTQMQRESQAHISGLQEKEFLANRKERQYRIAIMSSAFSTFEFNLTRDLIENDIVHTENGEQSSLLEKVGLQAPCRASECFEKWKAFIEEESIEDYASAVNLDYLKERFQAGEADVTVDYWSHGVTGRQMCIRQSFIMTSDERSGDIMVMVVSKDITAQVQKQREQTQALRDALMQAQRANSAKTVFLSNMSHDIRTPMNAIVGFTALALTHIEQKEQVEEYLRKIMTSGNHLLSLINDVLDMSRIESGKMHLEEKPCSLPEILHGLRSIVQPDIHAKQLELYIDTVDILDENIICDKLRLNQVLLNLLSNSVKYTCAGGIVSIRVTEKTGAPAGYADYEFLIKDTGIGMSKEFVTHIFEPFEREKNTTLSGIQGTGLGMAITKNIVDMMNGSIEVKSEQGVGTEFKVSFRLRLNSGAGESPDIPQLKNCRALVVDDDFNTCDSVTYMLQQIGMRSEWTLSGKEAVLRTHQAVMRNDSYCVYIIDWMLPDMNGIEVTRRIRKETGGNAPIIVLTAYDWADVEDEAKEAGVTAFCSKPLFLSELRSCLSSIVNTEGKDGEGAAGRTAEALTGRILLAEDNELNQEIAEAILEDAGFKIEIASNGREAVDMLKKAGPGYYQLILMDVQMPVLDGYGATRIIRGLADQKLASIPILAMTANAFEEDRQEALKCGMNGHIAKPVDVEKLMETLEEILS